MIAKAMAKNPTGANKAELDRLAAEFSDELDALDVRVSELEKYADKVVWHGELRYTYQSNRFDRKGGKQYHGNVNENLIRLEPIATVNDHWKVGARIDLSSNLAKDTSSDAKLQRAWAEGTYGNFNLNVGTFSDLTDYDRNMMSFNEMSGAELNFGTQNFKAQLRAGRLNTSDNLRYDDSVAWVAPIKGTKYRGNDPLNMQSFALTYSPSKSFSLTGAYYHFNSDIFRNAAYSKNMNEDNASIWEVASTLRFGKLVSSVLTCAIPKPITSSTRTLSSSITAPLRKMSSARGWFTACIAIRA